MDWFYANLPYILYGAALFWFAFVQAYKNEANIIQAMVKNNFTSFLTIIITLAMLGVAIYQEYHLLTKPELLSRKDAFLISLNLLAGAFWLALLVVSVAYLIHNKIQKDLKQNVPELAEPKLIEQSGANKVSSPKKKQVSSQK